MASLFGFHIPGTKRASAFKEVGESGTAVFGGYVQHYEKNSALGNEERYRTASDILANISIIAASVRYFLNILSEPKWTVEPADDSAEAEEMAEFVESVMHDLDSSWSQIVRRAGMYRYHGFSIQEWTAKKREDGRVGFTDIESRPQHTIERWVRDETGKVVGVWQQPPQTGVEIPIDRWKLVYLVDDMLTDSPEGMGWFRHLVEPATRLKEYLNLEKLGYDRDMSGIPIGRAPITDINSAVKNGKLSQAQANTILSGMQNFVQAKIKKNNTGMVLDSKTYLDTGDNVTHSSIPQWGIELLKGDPGAIQELGEAINRTNLEMARIMGTEAIMMGADGKGSLALSKDKSSNLYIQVNSTLKQMTEQLSKDVIDPLWALNGFDDKLKPKFVAEDVTFHTLEEMAAVISDLASSGVMLTAEDDATKEMFRLMGLTAPEPMEVVEPPKPQGMPPAEVLDEEM